MNAIVAIALSAIAAAFIAAQPAAAQSSSTTGESMETLLEQGFEIKAAAPNGDRYVVFLQKDTAAYACEFVTVTNSRCGAINEEAE
ncbi:MAG: hypothetical protein AAF724_16500 [Pseudomonadota bacterium]